MKSTPGWWKRYCETSSVASGTTCSASGGSPASSPAACSRSIARCAQRAARADGRKMTALRVLAATIDLNSAVEVGLVIGSSARTTPIGSATYWIPRSCVLVDDADRPLVLEVVVEELGRDVVLDDLVLEDAEAGLLHGELGEVDRVLQAGDDHRPDDPVDRLLVEAAQRASRLVRTLDDLVEARVRRSTGHGLEVADSVALMLSHATGLRDFRSSAGARHRLRLTPDPLPLARSGAVRAPRGGSRRPGPAAPRPDRRR